MPVSLLLDRSKCVSLLRFPMLGEIDPSNLLVRATIMDRSVRFPMENGITPEKLLDNRYSSFNFVSFPMLSGMTPSSKLFVKSIHSRLARFPISDGMTPDMLLLSASRNWRLVDRLVNELGSFPANLLSLMHRTFNLLQFLIEGMKPHSCSLFASNLLSPRMNTSRFCNLPNSEGRTLVKLLLMMERCWSLERLVRDSGRAPVNRLFPFVNSRILGRLFPRSAGRWPCSLFSVT
ncbi:hypothetical protein PVAP13_5NG381923 [Panicum virgatum]|uniref:Uncharacterized protein n=1 Tax=Panicum virgatum TaxID=38727 RepID=A0A8T0RUX6_PANVG|nr:hypothetical protein PVAP13_5NG381923 [Panicum virgatum]